MLIGGILLYSGGAEEIRTPGLDNANVARSQLRYSPIKTNDILFPTAFLVNRNENPPASMTKGIPYSSL